MIRRDSAHILCGRTKGGRQQRASRLSGSSAGIEALESRTLLHAVFDPVFGVETQKQDGSDGKMFRPPINVVFWGPDWQGSNSSNPDQWNSANSPSADAILG